MARICAALRRSMGWPIACWARRWRALLPGPAAAADAADCKRLWLGLTLGQGAGLLTSGPVAGAALRRCLHSGPAPAAMDRPERPAGPPVLPIPGTLATLGLALRL